MAAGPRRGTVDSGIVLNDVLIWVLVPALSYLAGALFQAGYNHYFGLPDELVSADPVAIFQASRRYQDLILHHFSIAVAVPLALVAYLLFLPSWFYRAYGAVVLAMAGVVLCLSFGVRPYVWGLAVGLTLVVLQFLPHTRRERLERTNPTAVKTLAIVAFLYATLFAAGYDSAAVEHDFFVSDHGERFVMLVMHDTVIIAAPLLDRDCKPVKVLPESLAGYHFDRRIKAFTLGDADTPAFRVYQTTGLTPCGASADAIRSPLPAPFL